MINLKARNFEIKNIETMLFDKDGTIIDLHYFWGKMTELRAKEVIKYFNLNENLLEQLCLYLGFDINTQKMLSDGITALYSRVKIIEIFTKKLEELNIKTNEEKITELFNEVNKVFYSDMEKYTKPIKEAVDFIEKVRSLYPKIKIGIVTSDSKESTDLTIKHFNWHNLFDFVAGREMSTETKESGALTKLALSALNANPKTTIMFGDTPMDYLSAINADVNNIILIASGQIEENELEKTISSVVSSFNEIEIV